MIIIAVNQQHDIRDSEKMGYCELLGADGDVTV